MHPVHRVVASRLLRGTHEVSAQLRPRGRRGHGRRLEDLEVRDRPLHHAPGGEEVVQPLRAGDVVVGEIEARDTRVVELQPVLGAVTLDEPKLDHPVQLPVDQRQVARLEGPQPALPQVEHLLDDRRRLDVPVHVLTHPVEVLPLDVHRGGRAAVRQLDGVQAGRVVADLPDRPDGVLQGQVAHRHTGLDEPEHQVGGADLEHRGRLGHRRVPHDDVQATVALGVGVGLVTRVDDRPRARGGAGDRLPDVVGALRQAVDRATGGREHLARAGEHLPRDEERHEDLGQAGEVTLPPHEVVLVTAVRVAGRVGVVLEQVHLAREALVLEALLRVGDETFEDALPAAVVRDELPHVVALGGRVLRVRADVEVQARAVAEEDVGGPAPLDDLAEEVARGLVGADRRAGLRFPSAVDRDPVLGLQADDAGSEAHCPPFCTKPLTKDSALVSSTVSISPRRSSSSADCACALAPVGSGGGVGSSGSRSLRRCCS